jgi:23S rRNA (adenine2503-C2)-methyltransferase
MRQIKELTQEELEEVLAGWGVRQFYAVEVLRWIYQRQAADFTTMSNLPGELREKLAQNFSLQGIKLVRKEVSRDRTKKFLFSLSDGNLIESVLIPAQGRATGCISTQAGCKFSCRFCASGLAGFRRNLSSAEMLDQVLYLKADSGSKQLTHIVFMGTGEPLDNYDAVLKAIRLLNAKSGLGIGARRITISTCGIVPGIARFAKEGLQVELSVSLHAPDDKTRSRLLPVNKKYPLKELLAACRDYSKKTKRQVTFEYVLIKGLNSDLPSAEKLSKIIQDLPLAKVNLIPANPVRELGIQPPGKLETLSFKDCLLKRGVNVTLRMPRGQDIQAACGQLRLRYEQK